MFVSYITLFTRLVTWLVASSVRIKGSKTPGPEVIELFSSSAQLSMKFELLINVEIVKISGKFRFKTKKLVIYPAHKDTQPYCMETYNFDQREHTQTHTHTTHTHTHARTLNTQ